MLVTVTHYNWPVEDAHTGFTYIRDTASVIRNQWGETIQYFKVLDLLLICQIYVIPIRLFRNIREWGFVEQGNRLWLTERTTHKYYGFPKGRTRGRITHFGQIYGLNSRTRN